MGKKACQSIKLRRVRILIEESKSWLRGWPRRYSFSKISPHKIESDWYCVAEKFTNIKMRKGIEEINANRISNMKVSCAIINGIKLDPGEIFSLRKVVGEATADNGFKPGPVLIRGKLHFTYGGGLCQISSTLFNAALLANMHILEKHNHSFDIWGEERFTDLGLDATYVYALKDLKFRNLLGQPTAILMHVDENELRVCCRFLAPRRLPYEVSVKTHILKRLKAVPSEKRQVSSELKRMKLIDGWIVRTTRQTQKDDSKIVTYQKTERYKPLVLLLSTEDSDTYEN